MRTAARECRFPAPRPVDSQEVEPLRCYIYLASDGIFDI
ncbi:hypothetical protein SS05631_a47250 (plasmid) [Sinorhizobium sp. CCBAU 05631]|nr:hypothetical protein SS05631_a47250 [Sinorhizobium sp. CCBAU 05631]